MTTMEYQIIIEENEVSNVFGILVLGRVCQKLYSTYKGLINCQTPQDKNTNIVNFILPVPLKINPSNNVCATLKYNPLLPLHISLHIYWHHLMQIEKKTANIWEYKRWQYCQLCVFVKNSCVMYEPSNACEKHTIFHSAVMLWEICEVKL